MSPSPLLPSLIAQIVAMNGAPDTLDNRALLQQRQRRRRRTRSSREIAKSLIAHVSQQEGRSVRWLAKTENLHSSAVLKRLEELSKGGKVVLRKGYWRGQELLRVYLPGGQHGHKA